MSLGATWGLLQHYWDPSKFLTLVGDRYYVGNTGAVLRFDYRMRDGGFYGWPYSFYGQHVDPRVKLARPGFVATALASDYGLGPHVAPLGLACSRGECASHHINGDMAFLAKAHIRRLDQKQNSHGELAVVCTRSRITSQHKDKAVDVFSGQTMVLKRIAGGWRTVHIHWSSLPASKGP